MCCCLWAIWLCSLKTDYDRLCAQQSWKCKAITVETCHHKCAMSMRIVKGHDSADMMKLEWREVTTAMHKCNHINLKLPWMPMQTPCSPSGCLASFEARFILPKRSQARAYVLCQVPTPATSWTLSRTCQALKKPQWKTRLLTHSWAGSEGIAGSQSQEIWDLKSLRQLYFGSILTGILGHHAKYTIISYYQAKLLENWFDLSFFSSMFVWKLQRP